VAKIPNPPQFTPKIRAEGSVQFSKDDFYKLRTAIDDIIRAMREMNDEIGAGGSSSVQQLAYPPQLGHSRI
jgi:hypothetical protein